ncbi:fatty acid desaturase family protein [Sphingomonas jatrophae]|uniref:Fatty acid desaturase n=1 Tax=Sphingomonas jatrophae TaxID=1166337 RepID=A0A1I6LBM7_9SPHN|nr:fatty acid desaturase [Sphingomonas jatrophae]SFS00863.1 Fatty acid desaturase [Sphingomonas jatrophae]
MTSTTLSPRDVGAAAPARGRPRGGDDAALLRVAAEAARDFAAPDPRIFWADMLASATLGYAALVAAILLHGAAAWGAGVVAALALYRAGSFIHELTHVKHAQLRGFRLGWNLAVGVPLLAPSFMYEGVHTLHHARTRYGTIDDPEYLPLARMKPWTVPLFVLTAALAPIALIFRFAVLTPLSLLSPRLRATVVARYSALAINPAFRRRPPEGALARQWRWQEAGASLWAIALVLLVATGTLPLRAFLIGLGVTSAMMVVNQIRTLVAHLWENEGEAMSVTAQYLDSVNVPPPTLLPALWAPVGLRYHALHHLLPSVPYHRLGAAHRRLVTALGADSPYHAANHPGLPQLVARLVRGTLRG